MNKIITTLALIFIFLISGCATAFKQAEEQTKEEVPPSDLSYCKTEDEAAKVMIESILKGLSKKNYQEFSRDFASKEKTSFSQKAFYDACKAVEDNLGELLSKEYLGSINKINYYIAIWKAKYSKAPEDIILEMYIIRENDTFKVSAFIPK